MLASPAVPGTCQQIWERLGLAGARRSTSASRPTWRGAAIPAGSPSPRASRCSRASRERERRRREPCASRDVSRRSARCCTQPAWPGNAMTLDRQPLPRHDDEPCRAAPTRPSGGPDAGVGTMITVGCDRATSLAALDFARRHPAVHATVGLHPHEAATASTRSSTSSTAADRPAPIAVGECGLDYYYDHSPRDAQRDGVRGPDRHRQRAPLPLVIHTRDAWDDTFDVLAAEGVPERTIFHCFTGGPDEAARCLDHRRLRQLLRHRHVQARRRRAGRGRLLPARAHAGRDRQPVPRPGAAPRPNATSRRGCRSSAPAWPRSTAVETADRTTVFHGGGDARRAFPGLPPA